METKIIHLYIKTHNITGLKYFGKTIQDPFKYCGSGRYWKNHIKKYGKNISTEIFGSYNNYEKCLSDAIEFSIKNDISNSDKWANLVIEKLEGGDTSSCPNFQQRNKIWISNGILEMMVFPNEIPSNFYKGRLLQKAFNNGAGRFDNKGTKWWNNGVNEIMSNLPPNNTYSLGRLHKRKTWWNDGFNEKQTISPLISPGVNYTKGRLKNKNIFIKRLKWWNNNIIEVKSFFPPDNTFTKGRLFKGIIRN